MQHEKISIDNSRFFNNTYIGNPKRSAQDFHMMYKCIMDSLLVETKPKVNLWSEEYNIRTQKPGKLLIKVAISESHLDKNATTSQIRIQLSTLDDIMATCGHYLFKSNRTVKVILDLLKVRGANIFKGYAACSDKVFIKYVAWKEECYEEGIDIFPDNLMHLAVQKFNIIKITDRCNAPSDSEENIIKNFKNSANRPKGMPTENETESKKKSKTSKDKKNILAEKPSWMFKEPEYMENPRTWNNKIWWLCLTKTGGKCDPG